MVLNQNGKNTRSYDQIVFDVLEIEGESRTIKMFIFDRTFLITST